MGQLIGVCLSFSTLLVAAAQFDGPMPTTESIRRQHYVVLSAENTALQKFLMNKQGDGSDPVAHLLVDGQALIAGEALNLQAIDWVELKADLQSIYERKLIQQIRSPPKRTLMIKTYFTGNPGKDDEFINWTLGGFAKQAARFEVVNVTTTHSSGGSGLWERFDRIASEYPKLVDEQAEENPKENDHVKVFPVRTFLSRFLTDNADCVVVIKAKFTEDFNEELPRAVSTSMSVFSRQLQFNKKQKVFFSFTVSQGGEKVRDWFIEEGARQLQLALGFQSWVVGIGYQ